MILDLCEDCGSTNVVSRPDGLDTAGNQKFWLQCKQCYSEWYDTEADGLVEEDWLDFIETNPTGDPL